VCRSLLQQRRSTSRARLERTDGVASLATMSLTWQFSNEVHLPILARLNAQLVQDEGHSNPMGLGQLEARMRGWLETGYTAVIFREAADVVAYALYRPSDSGWEGPTGAIYLRQFFVVRNRRREGIGREAIEMLRSQILPAGCRITLETLLLNTAAQQFWRSLGFRDYCLTFEWSAPRGAV